MYSCPKILSLVDKHQKMLENWFLWLRLYSHVRSAALSHVHRFSVLPTSSPLPLPPLITHTLTPFSVVIPTSTMLHRLTSLQHLWSHFYLPPPLLPPPSLPLLSIVNAIQRLYSEIICPFPFYSSSSLGPEHILGESNGLIPSKVNQSQSFLNYYYYYFFFVGHCEHFSRFNFNVNPRPFVHINGPKGDISPVRDISNLSVSSLIGDVWVELGLLFNFFPCMWENRP